MIPTSGCDKKNRRPSAVIALMGVAALVIGLGLITPTVRPLASSLLALQPGGQAGGGPGQGSPALASRFPGSDCGAKINAADDSLGSSPGEIWIDQACGTVWTTNLRFSGSRVLRFVQGGTYKVPTIELPAGLGRFTLLASGVGMTILQAASPNTPVILCNQSGNDSDGDYLAGFSVQANASGSIGPAIDTSGCRATTFENISYLSNGAANFGSFFRFSSSPHHCYGIRVVHPLVQKQTGPSTVFLFDNNGRGDAAYNANVIYLEDVWIYGNTGISVVFDARRSALTSITGGDVEANRGATVLIPGGLTTMSGVWLEANATESVVGMSGPDGSSNGVHLTGNYITPQTFTIARGEREWVVQGNMPGVNLTIRDMSGEASHVLQKPAVH